MPRTATGFGVQWQLGSGALRAEVLLLFSKHNPERLDQTRPDRQNGSGRNLLVSYEIGNLRAAFLHWYGNDFLKWEGDPNYGSLADYDGVQVINRHRTYDELSLSRRFILDARAHVIANVRLHWVDGTFDYSYRIAAAVNLNHQVRRQK